MAETKDTKDTKDTAPAPAAAAAPKPETKDTKDTKDTAPAPAAAAAPKPATKAAAIPVIVREGKGAAKSIMHDGKEYEAGEYRYKANVGPHYRPTDDGLVRLEPGEVIELSATQAYAFGDKFVKVGAEAPIDEE